LKTASGTNFIEKRYFDTSGYYFDVEAGKSFYTKNKFINEIRAVGNLGFFLGKPVIADKTMLPCTDVKLIVGNKTWKLDNTLSGYWGWIHTSKFINMPDYGDTPLVYATKFSIKKEN